MTPNTTTMAGLGAIMALAAAAAHPFGYDPTRRRMPPTPENTKRRDKLERNKRKQQKTSRRRNRG